METASVPGTVASTALALTVASGPARAIVLLDEGKVVAGGGAATRGKRLTDLPAATRASLMSQARTALERRMSGKGARIARHYDNFPVIVADVDTASGLDAIWADTAVSFVDEERRVAPNDVESFDPMNQPEAAAAERTGQGTSKSRRPGPPIARGPSSRAPSG